MSTETIKFYTYYITENMQYVIDNYDFLRLTTPTINNYYKGFLEFENDAPESPFWVDIIDNDIEYYNDENELVSTVGHCTETLNMLFCLYNFELDVNKNNIDILFLNDCLHEIMPVIYKKLKRRLESISPRDLDFKLSHSSWLMSPKDLDTRVKDLIFLTVHLEQYRNMLKTRLCPELTFVSRKPKNFGTVKAYIRYKKGLGPSPFTH